MYAGCPPLRIRLALSLWQKLFAAHRTLSNIVKRKTVYGALGITAALLGIYAALGYLLVPYLVERSMPGYVQENLGAQATIGKVRFDPFLLKLEADAFQLSTQSAQPVVGFERLVVDLDLASIPNWAWTFGNVSLDGLRLEAEIDKDGRLNLAELADHWSARHPKQPEDDQAGARDRSATEVEWRHRRIHRLDEPAAGEGPVRSHQSGDIRPLYPARPGRPLRAFGEAARWRRALVARRARASAHRVRRRVAAGRLPARDRMAVPARRSAHCRAAGLARPVWSLHVPVPERNHGVVLWRT